MEETISYERWRKLRENKLKSELRFGHFIKFVNPLHIE